MNNPNKPLLVDLKDVMTHIYTLSNYLINIEKYSKIPPSKIDIVASMLILKFENIPPNFKRTTFSRQRHILFIK